MYHHSCHVPCIMYHFHMSYVAHRILVCSCPSGNTGETRGRAFVVYEDIYDAKNAVEHLNGFNVLGRYIVVLYYQPKPKEVDAKQDINARKEKLEILKKQHGVKGMEE